MKLTTLDRDLAVHQKLPDEPNDVGGLSAQALKEKFDEAGLAIQSYLNDTHLPEVEEALEDALRSARDYADQVVVRTGAGDMAAAIYDTGKVRRDVYQYAHDEAVSVVGAAARFGYAAMGTAGGVARDGGEGWASLLSGADPRSMWQEDRKGFAVPQGARAFGVTAVIRWARTGFAHAAAELLVNGAPAARAEGPDGNDGQYRTDTVMLAAPVRGGDLVQLRLVTQADGGDRAEVLARYLRAEILM